MKNFKYKILGNRKFHCSEPILNVAQSSGGHRVEKQKPLKLCACIPNMNVPNAIRTINQSL